MDAVATVVNDTRVDAQEKFEVVIENLSSVIGSAAAGTSRVLLRLCIIGCFVWVLLTGAVSVYAGFRFLYLPTSSHLAPVHFNFNTANGQPTATVHLANDDSWLLRSGQTYDVSVVLDVPESDLNKDLGMVMVGLTLQCGKANCIDRKAERHTMLRYKSWLHETLETAVWWPLLVFNFRDDSQKLYVFMFEDFVDDSTRPVTRAHITLDKPVQLYHAQLRFDAHFTGLRHLMYWYPVTTGTAIVAVIFAIEALALGIVFAVLLYMRAVSTMNRRGSGDDMFDDEYDEDDGDAEEEEDHGVYDYVSEEVDGNERTAEIRQRISRNIETI